MSAKSKRERSTSYQLERTLAEIRKLQDAGHSARAISEITKIPKRSIEYYIKKINDQEQAKRDEINTIGQKQNSELLALQIYNDYKLFADVCREIIIDPKRSPKDRTDAGKWLLQCENNMFRMVTEGALKLRNMINQDKDKE